MRLIGGRMKLWIAVRRVLRLGTVREGARAMLPEACPLSGRTLAGFRGRLPGRPCSQHAARPNSAHGSAISYNNSVGATLGVELLQRLPPFCRNSANITPFTALAARRLAHKGLESSDMRKKRGGGTQAGGRRRAPSSSSRPPTSCAAPFARLCCWAASHSQ